MLGICKGNWGDRALSGRLHRELEPNSAAVANSPEKWMLQSYFSLWFHGGRWLLYVVTQEVTTAGRKMWKWNIDDPVLSPGTDVLLTVNNSELHDIPFCVFHKVEGVSNLDRDAYCNHVLSVSLLFMASIQGGISTAWKNVRDTHTHTLYVWWIS